VTDVKIINTNIKAGKIQRSADGTTWTDLVEWTNNSSYGIHYSSEPAGIYGELEDDNPYTVLYVLDDTHGLFELEGYTNLNTRYIKIIGTSTYLPNDYKYIGEVYIGLRYLKFTDSSVIKYDSNIQDYKFQITTKHNGKGFVTRSNVAYNATLELMNISRSEAPLIKDLYYNGGTFVLCPSPEIGDLIDPMYSVSDIYLVTIRGALDIAHWGSNTTGRLILEFMETEHVY
jgi:hypothetical protein